jgi:hypothetical protein
MRRVRAAAAAIALLSALAAGAQDSDAARDAAAAHDAAMAPQAFRRIAVVAGANLGGEGRAKLKYAASDARSFASVITELGGVRKEDLVLLIDPSLSDFRAATARAKAAAEQAAASGQRCEMVLFYSGHSDDSGLLLGKERLPYEALRADLERIPAAVRVAILDSCSSGSLTRAKGGAARPAFLFDASSDMEGHMYITSSSADEAAQESDRIGGSFFTHYLVSALRGAADTRGQGRVTLNEAYAFAFRETLASTENTQYGPQHPAYEISLTGSGDLVFTDLRSSSAGLALGEDLSGRLYVRDDRGALVVELEKPYGKRMELGLPPGTYALSYMDRDMRYQAAATVRQGGRVEVYAADFKRAATVAAVARGAEAETELAVPPPGVGPDGAASADAESAQAPPQEAAFDGRVTFEDSSGKKASFPISFSAFFAPDLSKGIFASEKDKVIGLNALMGMTRNLNGFELSSLFNAASGDVRGVQISALANASRGRAAGAQISGIVNVALGGGAGAQVGGLLSLEKGDYYGAQVAAANVAAGRLIGGQAGVFNYASFMGGPQLGVVNVVKEGVGAQVGVINACDELKGVQVGIINVAKRVDGIAIGLVSIEKGGILDAEAWWGSDSTGNAALIAGTRTTYTIASVGWDTHSATAPLSLGIGVGGRIPIDENYVGADLSWRLVDAWDPGVYSVLRLRVVAGLRAAGPGLILGCAVDALLPGISRDGMGRFVSDPKFEPLFIVGVHL